MREDDKNSAIGALVMEYQSVMENIAALESRIKGAGRTLEHLSSELQSNPKQVRIPGDEAHSPWPSMSLEQIQDCIRELRKANHDKCEMERCLEKAGLHRLIQP